VTTPVLDRIPHLDHRSRGFGVSEVVPRQARRESMWRYPENRIDQGAEGACVGFGWANELQGDPVRVAGIGNQFARELYGLSQQIDRERHNLHFPEGATVLAGAKATQQLGYQDAYRWAFGVDQVIDALVGHGPVVLGVNWYAGMYNTRPSGLVEIDGPLVGGHCITLFGYHPGMRIRGEGWFKRHEVVAWVNSWGPSYGVRGIGYVKVEDLDRLLREQGEACVPMHRTRPN